MGVAVRDHIERRGAAGREERVRLTTPPQLRTAAHPHCASHRGGSARRSVRSRSGGWRGAPQLARGG